MAHFEQCYRDGGYMNICMHPFVSGRALRIAMLDRLINRMKALPGVWFPTCEQVRPPLIRLARRLMPWKERYTISDERSFSTPTSSGRTASAAASASSSISAPACGPDGIKPQDLTTPDAYYGMNGGLAALLGVLNRYGIKATFAVPAVIAEIQADTLRRLPATATRSPRTVSSTRT